MVTKCGVQGRGAAITAGPSNLRHAIPPRQPSRALRTPKRLARHRQPGGPGQASAAAGRLEGAGVRPRSEGRSYPPPSPSSTVKTNVTGVESPPLSVAVTVIVASPSDTAVTFT